MGRVLSMIISLSDCSEDTAEIVRRVKAAYSKENGVKMENVENHNLEATAAANPEEPIRASFPKKRVK